MLKKLLFPPEYFIALLVGEVSRSRRRGYGVSVIALALELNSSLSEKERSHLLSLVDSYLCSSSTLRVSDLISRVQPEGTYLVMLPETTAAMAPMLEDLLKNDLDALLEGAARLRTARKSYSYDSPSVQLPDFSQLKTDLNELLQLLAPASPASPAGSASSL